MMGGLLWKTQQGWGCVPLASWLWLGLQVWLRLSLACLFSSFVKGQGEFFKGVSWGSYGRLDVKGPKALCGCAQATPDFLGHTVRRGKRRPHHRECAVWWRVQVGQGPGPKPRYPLS